jgi:hypothetical protein
MEHQMPSKKSEDAATSGAVSPPAPPSDIAVDTLPAPESPGAAPTSRRPVRMIVAAVLVLAVLGGAGWLAYSRVAYAGSPAGIAMQMLSAYAAYDAKGMLAVATHDTLTPADEQEFAKQATDAKTKSSGKPGVRNVKVEKVTETAADKVTVELSAEWLDPAKGTYVARNEKLVLIKKDGKWLVKLF